MLYDTTWRTPLCNIEQCKGRERYNPCTLIYILGNPLTSHSELLSLVAMSLFLRAGGHPFK